MITGKITANREAIIELEVIGSNQLIIDTGFNGYLTLPNDLINYLKLQLAGSRHVTQCWIWQKCYGMGGNGKYLLCKQTVDHWLYVVTLWKSCDVRRYNDGNVTIDSLL